MRRGALGLALPALLSITACAVRPPAPVEPGIPAYERYKNVGPMPVAGQDPGDPGPRVFASVTAVPRLRAFLRSQGTPDNLEVLQPRGENLRIHLNYERRDRRVVVERVEGRLSAYAPTRLDGSPLGAGPPPESEPPAEAPERTPPEEPQAAPPPPEPAPPVPEDVPLATELQTLECPIDPQRADCVRLCVPGAPYEWCP